MLDTELFARFLSFYNDTIWDYPKLQFPDDPDKYLQLYREYTDNKQKYIDMDCGHYVHVYDPDFIADEIKSFIGEVERDWLHQQGEFELLADFFI